MKKIFVIAMAVMLIFALMAPASVALAAKPGGQPEMVKERIILAADHHLFLQGAYDSYWGPPKIDNTWEWVIGTGWTGPNVQGISATGLLAAYERIGNTLYLDGAIAAGDTMVARYNAAPSQRTWSQDIEFLMRLSQDSGDDAYADIARSWYANTVDAFTAEGLADYYIDIRKSLAGWDLASQIRAALAVENVEYATGMASRLIERRADWEGVPYTGLDYTISSYASLLWAFAELDNNDFNGYIGEIRDALLDAQGDDGSWDGGDQQSTAYAILGLDADGTAKGAQDKAWAFLRDTQNSAGGWETPGGEYGEVNSEVIMALSALDLKGLKAGFTDPQPNRGRDLGKHKLDPMTP